MRKAQLTIEFFFVLALFGLVLYWLNYFAGTARVSVQSSGLLAQQRILLNDVASLSEQSCLENVSVSLALPCFFSGGSVAYNLVFSNHSIQVFPETFSSKPVEKNVSCLFNETSFEAFCDETKGNAGFACIKKTGADSLNFSAGVCE